MGPKYYYRSFMLYGMQWHQIAILDMLKKKCVLTVKALKRFM